MRRLQALSFFMVVPLAAACAQGETFYGAGGSGRGGGTPVGTGGANGTGGATSGTGMAQSSSSSSSSSNGGTVPSKCLQVDGTVGCCVGNTAYWCAKGSTTLTQKVCPGGQVCGWNPNQKYYSCVAPPGGADPTNNFPIACK
jgi:hypothetical protein